MPCDGKNPNCDRRRELLAQLKCLISSMDKKKPCEWDEPSRSPTVYCPADIFCAPPLCLPPECRLVKPCKSFDFRASIIYKCECIKRNGLQDRCMMWDCMGKPECMTKLYPVCEPGRGALLKLTDLGDVEVALKKFYQAEQVREAALAAYCKLVCDKARQKQTLPCGGSNNPNVMTVRINIPNNSDCNVDNNNLAYKSAPCGDLSYQTRASSQANPNYALQSSDICCPFLKLEEPSFSHNLPPVIYLPSYPPACPTRIPCSVF
ncbi:uncharacterized protein [Linepithema humile]|uniref:uncharacterized protein n=1 Tax=Linepithema humile TaxID=83485 RepID=UPI000623865F|nr:PREDICTED: uncharacterized protein LOC105671519 [Linepithema humile]